MLLKITTADGECKTISLAGKNSVMIGRSESADLYLADKKISRRHAEISINGDGIFLDDLSSRTGTRVNGESISGRTRLSGSGKCGNSGNGGKTPGKPVSGKSPAGAERKPQP